MRTKHKTTIAILAGWLAIAPVAAQAATGKGGVGANGKGGNGQLVSRFTVTKLDRRTVGLQWESRLNWVKILTRRDDPLVAARRLPDGRFLNTLILDAKVRLDLIQKFIEDGEREGSTRVGSINGAELPLERGDRRPALSSLGGFPAPGGSDASVDRAIDTMIDVIDSCRGTSGSPIAAGGDGQCFDNPSGSCHAGGEGKSSGEGSRPRGELSEAQKEMLRDLKNEPSGDPMGGGRGVAWAFLVKSLWNYFTYEEPEETGSSEEGHDDAEGCEGTEEECEGSAPQASPAPAPQATPAPGASPGGSGGQPTPAPTANGAASGGAGMPGEESTCDAAAVAAAWIFEYCEAADWQTYDCQKTVRLMNGCADSALINPAPEGGDECNGEGLTADEIATLECKRRSMIAQPTPDGIVCESRRPSLDGFPSPTMDLCSNPRALVDEETCAAISAGASGGSSNPGGSRPGPGQPGPSQPGPGKPGLGKPGLGKPGLGKPGLGSPGPGKPMAARS